MFAYGSQRRVPNIIIANALDHIRIDYEHSFYESHLLFGGVFQIGLDNENRYGTLRVH